MNSKRSTGSSGRLLVLWLTLAVWGALVLVLGASAFSGGLREALGDTDDALRLVLVRDLLSGRAGWYDQHFMRIQPPLGMDLHWSRLVDGGIAGVDLFFRLFLSPPRAEYAARVAWPLLWIGPAAGAAIWIARRLRGDEAAFACAALLGVTYLMFWQWAPGRIDHHDLQMTAALCALSGAVAGDRRGGWLAGAATAMGLAVGIEALVFLGLVGAAFALRFAMDPAAGSAPARAYAKALLVGLTVVYLAQTPPAWWGVARCDALGANLLAGAAAACLGVLATIRLTSAADAKARFVGLVASGAAAAGVYIGLEPACLHGPFALADPQIRSIWLSKVAEMQTLPAQLRGPSPDPVGVLMLVLGAAAWLWLGRRRSGRTAAWMVLGVCFLAAGAMAAGAVRLTGYSNFFAAPMIAAAAADIASHARRGHLTWAVVLAMALSPSWPAAAFNAFEPRRPHGAPTKPGLNCTAPSALRVLATQPAGVVLGEIDLGPYILAETPHAVLAAPYHRAGWGIVAADAALAAASGRDEAAVRALHADYVVTCPAHDWYPRRRELGPQSLQVRLDRGHPPAWLEPLSAPGETLQVYGVRPAARASSRN